MALSKQLDKAYRLILKYDTSRAYIGEFTPKSLYDLHKMVFAFLRADYAPLTVGQIDNNVICNSLIYEMSYNPIRYESVINTLNQKSGLYKFCSKKPTMTNDEEFNTHISNIHLLLTQYMHLNAKPNNQWNDVFSATPGDTISVLSENTYNTLASLTKTMHAIAIQNLKDFTPKKSPFRQSIINTIAQRHPTGIRKNTPYAWKQEIKQPADDSYVTEDRLDKQLDNIDSILMSPRDISQQVYEQLIADRSRIVQELQDLTQKKR